MKLSHVSLSKSERGGAGYWTKARVAKVKPAPLPEAAPGALPNLRAQPRAGRPLRVQPQAPTVGSQRPVRKALPVLDPTQYPYSANGLVLFNMGGGSYGCSGTVIASPNQSVVFTAGHCVNDGGPHGPWANHFVFAPGYHDGIAPFGYFKAREIWSTGPWLNSGNFSYDMGAVVLQRRAGQTVGSVAGSRGIAFNQDRNQTYDAFGYPGGGVFDGEHQEECLSPFLRNDTSTNLPLTFAITCDMTEGASGGGWIIGDHFENGLTSYGYTNEPNALYSPYFGNAAKGLWRKVRSR